MDRDRFLISFHSSGRFLSAEFSIEKSLLESKHAMPSGGDSVNQTEIKENDRMHPTVFGEIGDMLKNIEDYA